MMQFLSILILLWSYIIFSWVVDNYLSDKNLLNTIQALAGAMLMFACVAFAISTTAKVW